MVTGKTTWLVTGSSRGIGLGFIRQLAASPNNLVIATCRTPESASDLKQVADGAKADVRVVPLDTGNVESIKDVEKYVNEILGEGALDYLLNNAAIMDGRDDKAFGFDPDVFGRTLGTNVIGPALLAETLLAYLERSKRPVVMNMTSGLGSIGSDCGPNHMTYSVSKTALNMLTYKQSKQKPNIIFYCVDPGWTKTDMGGSNAHLEVEFSVSKQLELLTTIAPEQSGKCFLYDGKEIPW